MTDWWCGENLPEPPVDVCKNIEGNQEAVPEGYVEKDGICNEIVEEEEPTPEPTPEPAPITSGK